MKRAIRIVILLLVLAAAVGAAAIVIRSRDGGNGNAALVREKAAILQEYAQADWVRTELGANPAGDAGYAVFFSLYDGDKRAAVHSGTGKTLEDAWDNAVQAAAKAQRGEPVWVKADVVYLSETIPASELAKSLQEAEPGFFRYGAALDRGFETALLEAELNSADIYDYQSGSVSLEALNRYLEQAGRNPLESLPEEYTVFQSVGWICDEENDVYELSASGLSYGRRRPARISGDYALALAGSASAWLADQVQEDGSFRYGVDPRYGTELEGYNILRHASAIRSLILRYRMTPDDSALAETVGRAVEYLTDRVVERDGAAYLCDDESEEIRLGGCGLAVIALTDYMNAFQTDQYEELCEKLGRGILSMLDQETGVFCHVLNLDFSPKEEFRAVYYDGEAAYALCRLYGLTGDQIWLDAARRAVDHMIQADYTRYRDHWVAYSLNEFTKYAADEPIYYIFALQNVQDYLEEIAAEKTAQPTYLELLLAGFETYDRMTQRGYTAEGFDLDALLNAISIRAERMLNGYFFPEYTMYMAQPQQISETFMTRQDGFRVRIDDVHHNIAGYYLYYKNYDRLVEYGLLDVS